MKIQNYKIDQFCKDQNPNTPAILLYGQDYGLISERSSLIIKNFFKNMNHAINSINIIDLELNAIISNPEFLDIEASSISILNNKKIIRIKDATDSLSKIIEEYLLTPHKDCLIIILT